MIDPKEFSSMDDSPTNTGTFGNDRDWEEIRIPRKFMYEEEDPSEDCWDSDDDYFEEGGES